jgi:hypothetical protein
MCERWLAELLISMFLVELADKAGLFLYVGISSPLSIWFVEAVHAVSHKVPVSEEQAEGSGARPHVAEQQVFYLISASACSACVEVDHGQVHGAQWAVQSEYRRPAPDNFQPRGSLKGIELGQEVFFDPEANSSHSL